MNNCVFGDVVTGKMISVKEMFEKLLPYSQGLLLIGGFVGTLMYGFAAHHLQNAKVDAEAKLREELVRAEAKIREEQFLRMKAEAIQTSTENFFKYSHSEEYASLRPKSPSA